MLSEAVALGRPVVPVFVLDPETEGLGAAVKFRLGLAVARFAAAVEGIGLRLVMRRGPALAVLAGLAQEVGAGAVLWSRLYDPISTARDAGVKAGLRGLGLRADSFAGHVLSEPWDVVSGTGGFYKVYTPYWKAVRGREMGVALPLPAGLRGPDVWPVSERLADWRLDAAMVRGAAVVGPHQHVGEAAAQARLTDFLDRKVDTYKAARDFPALDVTSGLSENLTYGEISPRQVWHGGMRAMLEGRAGAEHFLKELVWREFAYHLIYHTPEITTRNWRPEWDSFDWRGDNADAERWRRGMTGEPFVDAAMRQMFVTGTMHNRARMIVGSYLTKHLLTDWRVGLDWFAECLTDWDPAANALGWQWVAGSGPDAAPYFRVFNPETQGEKFDANQRYRRRFIAEGQAAPGADALAFFKAVPKSWGLSPKLPYPKPMVDLGAGRDRALAAYAQRKA